MTSSDSFCVFDEMHLLDFLSYLVSHTPPCISHKGDQLSTPIKTIITNLLYGVKRHAKGRIDGIILCV